MNVEWTPPNIVFALLYHQLRMIVTSHTVSQSVRTYFVN